MKINRQNRQPTSSCSHCWLNYSNRYYFHLICSLCGDVIIYPIIFPKENKAATIEVPE